MPEPVIVSAPTEPRYPAVTAVLFLGMPRTAILPAIRAAMRAARIPAEDIDDYTTAAGLLGPVTAALPLIRIGYDRRVPPGPRKQTTPPR